jgi:hypothetical protein
MPVSERRRKTSSVFERILAYAMEEITSIREAMLSPNTKRAIVIVGAIVIVLATTVSWLGSQHLWYDPHDAPPTHTFSVWVEPRNYTFHVHFDFYPSMTDAENQINRQGGHTFPIRPFDDVFNPGSIYGWAEDTEYRWVRVYVTVEGVEVGHLIMMLTIGVSEDINIAGYEITVLIKPSLDGDVVR